MRYFYTILLSFIGFIGSSQNQWDIQLTQSSLSCMTNQVCYQVELQNTSGANWTLGDQNYRFFFDGDYMTVLSVTSLLPTTFYGTANIDQNIKISGQGQEVASPLDAIDDNLGFLDFSIVQTDKSNPAAAAQLMAGNYIPTAEICLDVAAAVINDASGTNCLSLYHSRPSTAGAITNQYTVISENNLPNNTIATQGVNYDDLTPMDGAAACLGTTCAPAPINKEWDIQLTLNTLDCNTTQACYLLQVQNTSGADWTISDQNYRLFFDGDYMTVTTVTSLLPSAYYGNAVIDMNTNYTGQGQEVASPLDDIDDNLGFLDFSIVQTDKSTPNAATQLTNGMFTSVAEICVDIAAAVINDPTGANCIAFYHSRPSTAGSFTNQYTTISNNDAPNSTTNTDGVNYDDLTPLDGADACLGLNCSPEKQWDIQLSQTNFDCDNNTACYQLEVKNTTGADWTLADQNYRLFFDGDYMTVTSVNSLLSNAFYSAANINMNTKYSGQGQDTASPLDDIDDNLGFLDFAITQTDKSNPSGATQLMSNTFTAVAEICVDIDAAVINDPTGDNCIAFYHSRPATAGSFSAQYTTLTENDAPNSTAVTMGANYDDLTSADGADACLGLNVPSCDIMGNTSVMENQQEEIFSGPTGVASYAWAVTSGDAVIDGASNQQNVQVDFGTTPSTLQLTTTHASGCARSCTLDVGIAANANEWDIQLNQSSLNCLTRQACYQLEVQNTAGTDWTIGDQNYRLFFDGDYMTVISVTSLLPSTFYGNAVIDMNTKYTGQGQETASPLDDIDDNLGFLDFNIVQTDKTNPAGATQLTDGTFTPVAEICVDIAPEVFDDASGNNCIAFYHSRPSTAGSFTNQYTIISENDTPNSTTQAVGINYNDLTAADGNAACLGLFIPTCDISGATIVNANTNGEVYTAPAGMTSYQWNIVGGNATINGSSTNQNVTLDFATDNVTLELTVINASGCQQTCTQFIEIAAPENQWDIRFVQNNLDCMNEEVCYQLEVKNTSGTDWTLGDQNYRLFFDGDLMTVVSVNSLIPNMQYSDVFVEMSTKYSGQGQEAASPLDDIDDNLGFLDFNIVQTDKTNPATAVQLLAGTFTPVAQICVRVTSEVINDQSGNNCLSFYHSRLATAGSFTNQYTTITENDAPNSTTPTMGVNYDDLTSADGAESCVGVNCGTDDEWNIQLTESSFDCTNQQACYQLEVQSNTANDWTLGDQNYRLFFDGDLMTVNSVTALLPNSIYGNAVINMNTKYSGQGQEVASPLDDIDDNLGFLDFNIIQTDKTNPAAGTMVTNSSFTAVAEICVDVDAAVFADQGGNTCIAFYHSRPSTAGTFTNQYTTLTENDAPNSTANTAGIIYNDLTSADGAVACLGLRVPDCLISGETVVAANTMNEMYSAPSGMNTYAWNILSGDAIIDGISTNQNVTLDFGLTNSILQLTVTNADGCSETCTLEIMVESAPHQWDIQLSQSSFDCPNAQVCYQLEVQSSDANPWALGDQNYRLFFDGDLMTVTSVTSLLPNTYYGNANIDQNIKISGQGQEAASPLDDIDDNLGFLDFNIVETDKSNPANAVQLTNGNFTAVAEICVNLDPTVLADNTGTTCLSFYHSRPSTAGNITNQYTTISENDAPFSTMATTGVNYDDLTSADGTAACLGQNIACTISGPTSVFANEQEVVFSNTTMANSYAWSILSGDAVIDGASNGQLVSIDFGTMNSTLQVITTNAAGCSATCTYEVTINPLTCNFTGPTAVCPNTADWKFTGPADADTYAWSITSGDATIDGANTIQVLTVDAGNTDFTVELSITPGSPATCSQMVTVNPAPTITANGNDACEGDLITLSGGFTAAGSSTSITNWNWTGPNGFTSTNQNPTPFNASAATAGTYTLTVMDNNGCTNSGMVTMEVFTNPVCDISGPAAVTENTQDVTYSTTTGMTSYAWSVLSGDAIIDGASNTENVTVDFGTTNATLQVTTTDNNGCSTTCTFLVSMTSTLTCDISGVSFTCENTTGLIFTAPPGATTYNWSITSGDAVINGSAMQESISVDAGSADFTVELSISPGSPPTCSQNVTVYSNPSIDLTVSDSTVCLFTEAVPIVYNSEVGVLYQVRNDADNSLVGNPVVGTGNGISLVIDNLNTAGTFTYTIIATDASGNCVRELTDKATLIVRPCDFQDNLPGCEAPPCHFTSDDIYLGAEVSAEASNNGTSTADTDNDDGAIFPNSIFSGGTFYIPTTVYNVTGNPANLSIWIDWNIDGDYEGAGEQIISTAYDPVNPLYNGTFIDRIPVMVPIDAMQNQDIPVRLRLSTDPLITNSPCGAQVCAADGEIEDYLIQVQCPPRRCVPVQVTINRGN